MIFKWERYSMTMAHRQKGRYTGDVQMGISGVIQPNVPAVPNTRHAALSRPVSKYQSLHRATDSAVKVLFQVKIVLK